DEPVLTPDEPMRPAPQPPRVPDRVPDLLDVPCHHGPLGPVPEHRIVSAARSPSGPSCIAPTQHRGAWRLPSRGLIRPGREPRRKLGTTSTCVLARAHAFWWSFVHRNPMLTRYAAHGISLDCGMSRR